MIVWPISGIAGDLKWAAREEKLGCLFLGCTVQHGEGVVAGRLSQPENRSPWSVLSLA